MTDEDDSNTHVVVWVRSRSVQLQMTDLLVDKGPLLLLLL